MLGETKTRDETVNMPHDKGYRDLFSNKENFLHFLNKYVKISWAKDLIPDDIEQVKETYIMQDYKKRESDVIYKLNKNNQDLYFYVLLEMQSDPDNTMPFRLLQYMVNILYDVFKNTPENVRESSKFRLPAIAPIVFYNGEKDWNVARTYKEYTANYEVFGNNIIDFKYLLFDLNRFNQEDILTTHKLLDFIFTMDARHISKSVNDFHSTFAKLAETQNELSDDDVKNLVSWFKYVILKGDAPENFEKEAVTAFRKGDVKTMTYAIDRLMERVGATYMEKGKEEGKYEQTIIIARKLLKRNRPIEEIMEDTGLTREEIEKLK